MRKYILAIVIIFAILMFYGAFRITTTSTLKTITIIHKYNIYKKLSSSWPALQTINPIFISTPTVISESTNPPNCAPNSTSQDPCKLGKCFGYPYGICESCTIGQCTGVQ